MFVGIAVVTAIRDQNTLAALFFLSFATMWCGYFTELLSRPALKEDGSGDYNYEKWANDPDPPKPLEEGADGKALDDHKNEWRHYTWARFKNYAWRMFPHILGFFPYVTAWVIILNNFFEQIEDLCDGLRDRMPDFVVWIVFGSAVIFSLFTFVQWRRARTPRRTPPSRAHSCILRRYQFLPPKHYWRTEVWYCVLSVREPPAPIHSTLPHHTTFAHRLHQKSTSDLSSTSTSSRRRPSTRPCRSRRITTQFLTLANGAKVLCPLSGTLSFC